MSGRSAYCTVVRQTIFAVFLLILAFSFSRVEALTLTASRTMTSFGQDNESRVNGVAFRPGFDPDFNPGIPAIQPLVAPREIALTGNDSLALAASVLPSACALIVAEGAWPGMAYIWEVQGEYHGSFYSTGSEGSAFPYGALITDLMQYDRNSIFMEMPPMGFPVRQFPETGGTTRATVHVQPPPVTPYSTCTAETRSITFMVGGRRGVHMELEYLKSETVVKNDRDWPGYPAGSIAVLFNTRIVGSFDPLESIRFRVYCDDRAGTVMDLFGPGAAWCVYPPDYKDRKVDVAVLAGSLGPGAPHSGVFVEEPAPRHYSAEAFASLGSTIGDTASLLVASEGCSSAISGTVSSEGTGSRGITVNLTGPAARTALTDANGDYRFSGLPDGTYTITPRATGCTFSPKSLKLCVHDQNVIWQDFTAACRRNNAGLTPGR